MTFTELLHPHSLYNNPQLSFVFIITSLWHIVLCFVLLGISASDFLCPSVASITDSHRTLGKSTGSEGILMAVILSWCNSSPDLFSNLMSWTGSSEGNYEIAASLSIGEVLGACGIILCVVIGSIFLLMDGVQIEINERQRSNILFDLSYTLVALIMLLYISLRNTVTIWNCFTMLSIYAVYLLQKYQKATRETLEQNDEEGNNINDSIMDITSAAGLIEPTLKPNLLSAMDFNSLLSMLERSRSNNEELQSVGSHFYHNHELPASNGRNQRPITDLLISVARENTTHQVQSAPAVFTPYYDDPEQQIGEAEQIVRQEFRTATSQMENIDSKTMYNSLKNIVKIALPHLKNFKQKSPVDAVLSVCVIPFVLVFRITCPQVNELVCYNHENGRYQFNQVKLIFSLLQGIAAPFLTFMLLSALIEKRFIYIWFIPSVIASGLIYETRIFYSKLLSVNKFSLIGSSTENALRNINEKDRRTLEKSMNILRVAFLAFGIINSILWISISANTVIEILELYQQITGISPAILGLTVFAWGNSISDLISNIAMCKLYKKLPHDEGNISAMATKFFLIACSSCIGGVLLNSMGGIGISGSIAMLFIHKKSETWWFLRRTSLITVDSENYKFILSGIVLVLECFVLIVIFGGPDKIREYSMSNMKKIGIAMCSMWIVTTIINTGLEIVSK
ncbi:hypothetical protein RNJ44_01587 [Nakaseomyces bracarensis]|uniref:Sodium/calcium exchanger membrane region domain-containing protein n=1 Tax=Nakaseomyces bracarensis TaxID=273131 RepID=A0ABR4NQ54_9SACH